jgi:hypothetical protein
VSGAFIVPRAVAFLSWPQSKRHCCESIATTEHSVGTVNGGPEAGAIAADGDTDASAVGAGGEDSLGAGAAVVGVQAVTKKSNPTARRNPLMRMTEP